MAAIKTGFGGLTWLTNSRRLRELESLYTAINKSQAVIELDMAGTVLTANDSYLEGKTRNGNLCTLSGHRQLTGAGP